MRFSIFLIILFNNVVFSQLEGFEDSYKRQIQLGQIDKSKTEFYDSSTKVFSNYKYGFSFKLHKNWDYDNGVGLLTVFRTFQKDSGIGLSINVMESIEKKVPSLHKIYDELGELFYQNGIKNQLKNTGLNLKKSSFKKSSFKGFESIDQLYVTSEIIEDFELETIHKGKVFWKDNIQFTIGFNLPKLYYDLNPEYFDSLLYEFSLLQNYRGIDFEDENLFFVNSIDIRKVNTYDLKSMVKLFLKDCSINGINIENVTQIKSTFEELERGTQGVSTGINKNGVEIKIDPVFWSNSSLIKKWYLIYHELGHDVLNLEHGEGAKMMFNFSDKEYTWDEFFEDKDYMFNFFKTNK